MTEAAVDALIAFMDEFERKIRKTDV